MPPKPPGRIVCLTEETVETLYLLGEETRIVGVSGYAVRPPRVRREKPRVSAFISADLPKILALEPDLVLAYSDLQADIVAGLIRSGIAVHAFNQRSVQGIFDMVALLGAMVGAGAKAAALCDELSKRLAEASAAADLATGRPRVYFEEWDGPLICGIGWVSELIAIAGGIDVFAKRAVGKSARERFVEPEEIIAVSPDIILGSWCGKRFRPEKLAARAGFSKIPAVASGFVREIKSPLILQPGPAALTDGLDAIRAIIAEWHTVRSEREA